MKKWLLGIAAVMCAISTYGDDGAGIYYPKIGAFTLSESDCIEMTEEIVDIRNDHVTVTFTFTNITEAARTVAIGFPVVDYPSQSWEPGDTSEPIPVSDRDYKRIEEFYNFMSTCNGEPLARKLVRSEGKSTIASGEIIYWFTAVLSFGPGEVLEVTNSYEQIPDYYGDSMGNSGMRLTYILTTGSSWSGPIKKAAIRYHSNDYNIIETTPVFSFAGTELIITRYSFSYKPTIKIWDDMRAEAVVLWEFTNLEPSIDLTINSYSDFQGFDPATIAWCLLKENDLMIDSGDIRAVIFNYRDGKKYATFSDWAVAECGGSSMEEFRDGLDDFFTIAFLSEPEPANRVKEYAQYIINAIYAVHGYSFKNQRWARLFSVFPWYQPETDTVNDFSARETEIIETLAAYR